MMDEANYASVASLPITWAQTTHRSPWLCFFLGFLFAPITGLVLLGENRKAPSGGKKTEGKTTSHRDDRS
jgi:hypothetical protein